MEIAPLPSISPNKLGESEHLRREGSKLLNQAINSGLMMVYNLQNSAP